MSKLERFVTVSEHYAQHVNIVAWMFVGAGVDELLRGNWLISLAIFAWITLAAISFHQEQGCAITTISEDEPEHEPRDEVVKEELLDVLREIGYESHRDACKISIGRCNCGYQYVVEVLAKYDSEKSNDP